MSVDAAALYEVSDATWPAARKWDDGPWTLRDGAGGGKRASAATARGDVTDQDIPKAEAAMKAMGQRSLFMIREGDDALDAMLAARGYDLIAVGAVAPTVRLVKDAGAALVGSKLDDAAIAAMVHAVEVLEHQRKVGVAQWMMRAAAFWGAKQGAQHIAVLCVTANKPANALYTKLGFTRVGTCHYRQAPQ